MHPTLRINCTVVLTSFPYDELNRISNAEETSNSTQTWKQTFTFDRYGNRNFNEAETTTLPKNCGTSPNFTVCTADKKIVNPSVNTANNRLSTSDDYAFDSSGNTTGDAEGRTFVYDAENKQISVSDSNGTIGEYSYDGDGKRIKKYVPGTGELTVFIYDAGSKLIGEYSTVVQTGTNAKTVYTTNDHLGSPRINTDATGQVISRHDYHPFGEEIARTGYGSDTIRKQFTGYERDIESSLDFAEARYYNPMHGRFAAVDPLLASGMPGNPQTWNRYVYVLNNPLFWVDPTGLIWGRNEDNEVRWFDKKLGKGFSEFTPDAWQYQSNGRTVQLDANSSNWNYIDPVEVVAENNPIQDLVKATGQPLNDAITGMETGVRNLVTDGINDLTQPLGSTGAALGIPNPFAIDPIPYDNARQAAYGLITQTGITAMATAGVGAAAAGPASARSSLSVVPEVESAATKTTGLQRQLQLHQDKLTEYARNPYAHDNKGFLRNNPQNLHADIIQGRVRNLVRQIRNYERQIK